VCSSDLAQRFRRQRGDYCGIKAVLGLSGGLDSAVVATLAAEALGAENVLAVMMSSPYTSRASTEDSLELSRRLGVQTIEKPIGSAFHSLRTELDLPHPSLRSRSCAL